MYEASLQAQLWNLQGEPLPWINQTSQRKSLHGKTTPCEECHQPRKKRYEASL